MRGASTAQLELRLGAEDVSKRVDAGANKGAKRKAGEYETKEQQQLAVEMKPLANGSESPASLASTAENGQATAAVAMRPAAIGDREGGGERR